MSVLKHDPVKNEEEVYFNFINSIKSDDTKKTYEQGVKWYLKFCNLSKLSELLRIGKGPYIAVDEQSNLVYLTSMNSNSLSIVGGTDNRVLNSFKVKS